MPRLPVPMNAFPRMIAAETGLWSRQRIVWNTEAKSQWLRPVVASQKQGAEFSLSVLDFGRFRIFVALNFQVCKTIHKHIMVKLLETEVHLPSLPASLDVKATREKNTVPGGW